MSHTSHTDRPSLKVCTEEEEEEERKKEQFASTRPVGFAAGKN